MNYLVIASAALAGGLISAAAALWAAKHFELFAPPPKPYSLSIHHPQISGSMTTDAVWHKTA